jgi:hypothetical protein
MNTFYWIIIIALLALGVIIGVEKFAVRNRKNKKPFMKRSDSFIIEKQHKFYEINSLQWDEYGNPYIYTGNSTS